MTNDTPETPSWTSPETWHDFMNALDDLIVDFTYGLSTHEFERLRQDQQFFNLVRDQVAVKVESVMETYRSKGMYAGYH